MIKGLVITFFLFSLNALAGEFRYLSRSPKGLLMGDAYTTLADDEFTLFYNPATLGRNLGVKLNFLNPTIAGNNVLKYSDTFSDFPDNDSSAIAERILGFPIYFRTGIAPYIKVGRFGFSFLADVSFGMELNNAVHPVLGVDYRYDRGFVIGYAYTWGKANKSKKKGRFRKNSGGKSNSLGIGAKYIKREGIKRNFHLFSTEVIELVDNTESSFDAIKDQLGYAEGASWGFDIGYEKSVRAGNTDYKFGISVTDIGGTHFKNRHGEGRIPPQDMFVNTGVSMNQDYGLFEYTLSLDLHPLNVPTSF